MAITEILDRKRKTKMNDETITCYTCDSYKGCLRPDAISNKRNAGCNCNKWKPRIVNEKKYRKRPVVITAYQTSVEVKVETLEGTMTANPGDWIITGVKGEKYPCRNDIFMETYEQVLD